MKRFASLTSRLVVTAVALVALVSLLIGTATTLLMREYLTDRLDDQIEANLGRERDDDGPGPPFGPGEGRFQFLGRGGLAAVLSDDVQSQGRLLVAGDRSNDPYFHEFTQAELAVLAEVPADGRAHDVELSTFGSFRVAAQEASLTDGEDGDTSTGVLVVGLPSEDVDETIESLIALEVLLGALGVVTAGAVALLVVRRQLRPLREVAATAERVAELPLASGDIELSDRVPAHLTDEATEVGQVGASLNTLLAHVETSLEARHRSEQQVRQFVADASHELRTPLTTIKGYAELARRRPGDTTAVLTALEKVESASGRMTSMVEDLLLLARLDSGRPLDREPVDLTRLLVESVSDARVLGPEHRWRLDVPDHELTVVGDEQRLHQLVTNLLTNARKHTPAGTTVTVAARDGSLTVHDDGPGFPPDLVGSAFERFARADSARTRTDGSGAGLGLALVDAIAVAHGGTVSLASRPGSTTITVRLPGQAPAPAPETTSTAARSAAGERGRERVDARAPGPEDGGGSSAADR